MSEGLPATEVGNQIAEHHERTHGEERGRDRFVTIVEAAMLAAVALLAAWSGYASAKWSTESRLLLAQASTARTEANRADADAAATVNFDTSTFNAWFTAYAAGNQTAMDVAARRFRPEFKVAFDAWWATNPSTNPNAPKGPTYMPQYVQPNVEAGQKLDATADAKYEEGAADADHADTYVRITVFLATVLFLVGISGHFRVRLARLGLIGVGITIMLIAVTMLLLAPKPPG